MTWRILGCVIVAGIWTAGYAAARWVDLFGAVVLAGLYGVKFAAWMMFAVEAE